jgi:hypothetical protein
MLMRAASARRADGRFEKRVDVQIEASFKHSELKIFVEHISTADITKDSYEAKRDALKAWAAGNNARKGAIILVYAMGNSDIGN